eukprot:g1063.t1
MLALELVHLMFRGFDPKMIVESAIPSHFSKKSRVKTAKIAGKAYDPNDTLALMIQDDKMRKKAARANRSSRHSRFGGQMKATGAGVRKQFIHNPWVDMSNSFDNSAAPTRLQGSSAAKYDYAESSATVELMGTSRNRTFGSSVGKLLRKISETFIDDCYSTLINSLRSQFAKSDGYLPADELYLQHCIWYCTRYQRFRALAGIKKDKLRIRALKKSKSKKKSKNSVNPSEYEIMPFKVGSISVTMKKWIFKWLTRASERFGGVGRSDGPNTIHVSSGSLAISASALSEVIIMLSEMVHSTSDAVRSAGMSLQKELFYQRDTLAILPSLLKNWKANRMCVYLLQSLVHATHAILKMADAAESGDYLMLSKRRKQVKRKKKKTAEEKLEDEKKLKNENNSENSKNDEEKNDTEKKDKDKEEDDDGPIVYLRTELDFRVNDYVLEFANNSIVKNYIHMLSFYLENDVKTNHYIISFLRRLQSAEVKGEKGGILPMLWQMSYFLVYDKILNDRLTKQNQYEDLRYFVSSLMRKFLLQAGKNPALYVEILFYRSRKENLAIMRHYEDPDMHKYGRKDAAVVGPIQPAKYEGEDDEAEIGGENENEKDGNNTKEDSSNLNSNSAITDSTFDKERHYKEAMEKIRANFHEKDVEKEAARSGPVWTKEEDLFLKKMYKSLDENDKKGDALGAIIAVEMMSAEELKTLKEERAKKGMKDGRTDVQILWRLHKLKLRSKKRTSAEERMAARRTQRRANARSAVVDLKRALKKEEERKEREKRRNRRNGDIEEKNDEYVEPGNADEKAERVLRWLQEQLHTCISTRKIDQRKFAKLHRTKTGRRGGGKKKEYSVKRTLSAYMLFSRSVQKTIQKEMMNEKKGAAIKARDEERAKAEAEAGDSWDPAEWEKANEDIEHSCKVSMAEVSKVIGSRWRAMSEESKTEFKIEAEKLKKRAEAAAKRRYLAKKKKEKEEKGDGNNVEEVDKEGGESKNEGSENEKETSINEPEDAPDMSAFEFTAGELLHSMKKIIKNADLESLTSGAVRKQLAEKFGVESKSLKPLKTWIHEKLLETIELTQAERTTQEDDEASENVDVSEKETSIVEPEDAPDMSAFEFTAGEL